MYSFEYLRRFTIHYLAVAAATLIAVATELMPPRSWLASFDRRDHRISRSFVAREIVGNRCCLVISGVVPLALIVAYCTVARSALRRRLLPPPEGVSKELHLLHASGVCLVLALTLAAASTCALKHTIGNPRPDFIERCDPPATATPLFSLDDCRQQDRYMLLDGLRSTPSGHASVATAGLTFAFRWQMRFTSTPRLYHWWCPLLALVVMLSRILDHKHFWSDVLAGCSLGLAAALIGWHLLTMNEEKERQRFQLPIGGK
ncbi:hypothetical protein HG537_0B00760 [Torulaspora globosa]|uniref:Phosphatidic acid phosphatase type 2/haloperoxidase domain-containing protein n=1 Tax=Torulaspora globosa TaxID=48254 RepID=A0A7H9HQ14_9SACH|nr:hypothetical protein HG537_0B00760 [Torulaspora sp. CBS 2947]